MNIRYQDSCQNIPWEKVPLLLEMVGMSFTSADIHQISFEASFAVIFVFDNGELIGTGRIISDGVRQSALYDIAVNPAYQGKGIGLEIVKRLMASTPACNFILYASPGKEGFYKKLNFKKMKTGMVFFANPDRMTDSEFVEED
ncbi:MAG: GNAT family N-acetyltransferase [Dysgonomonas sp.]|nr:GNAT family N-acetyltransferase [Dysgonomonas sp.]